MPSVSKAQQRFMGMVHSYKVGKLKSASSKVKTAAKSMSGKAAHDFASTSQGGLPEKKSHNALHDVVKGGGSGFLDILRARKGHKGGRK